MFFSSSDEQKLQVHTYKQECNNIHVAQCFRNQNFVKLNVLILMHGHIFLQPLIIISNFLCIYIAQCTWAPQWTLYKFS